VDFRYLEVFISVVEEGNFSKAAKALHLTQPTVSSHIDSLEKELGVILFERRSRQAVLTDAGKNFYPYAEEILQLKQAGMESVMGFKDKLEGNIKISASSTPGSYILPSLIKSFTPRSAKIHFEISISDSFQAVSDILNYRADIGFVGSVYENNQLEYIPIHEDELVVIAPNNAETARLDKSEPFRAIEGCKFILRRKGSATRETFVKALKKIGKRVESLNVAIEMDSLDGVIECVKQGIGISVISRICVARDQDLKLIKLTDLDLTRTFYATYQKKRVLSPVCSRFIDYLKARNR